MDPPPDTTDFATRSRSAAPWLILAGVAGVSLALLGVPTPVLSCVLLIGLGADADLTRRSPMFEAAGYGWLAAPLRALHGVLYVGLYAIGWAAMASVAAGPAARTLLAADLLASFVVLLGVARLRSRVAD